MSRGVRNSQPDPHLAPALRSPSGGPGHPYLPSLSPTPKPNQEGQAIARCANDTARLQAQWPRQCWAGNCTASVVGCLLAHQVSPNPNPNPNPTPNPTPTPNPKPKPNPNPNQVDRFLEQPCDYFSGRDALPPKKWRCTEPEP